MTEFRSGRMWLALLMGAALLALAASTVRASPAEAAECEVINATGEPATPEKEAEWRQEEARCLKEKTVEREAVEREAREEAEDQRSVLSATCSRYYFNFCDEAEPDWEEVKEYCREEELRQAEGPRITACWEVEAVERAAQRPREAREERTAAREARAAARKERELHRHLHTITEAEARSWLARELHREVGGWATAHRRELDCGDGRIDRTEWRCRVRWLNGGVCHAGRARIRVVHHTGPGIWTTWSGRAVRGYGYVEGGRFYCFTR